MLWAAGFVPRDPARRPHCAPHDKTDTHPQPTSTTWNCGFVLSHFRRISGRNGRTLTVIGSCFASDDELRSEVVRESVEYPRLMRWPGAYAVVLETAQKVVVLASPSGSMPMYYAVAKGGCWWSTAATPLAALVGAGVDFTALALDMATDGVVSTAQNVTPFAGILRVSPGGMLTVVRGVPLVGRWHECPTHADFGLAASNLREALHDSVSRVCTYGGVLSADVSGGLDSSTLAVLMADVRGFTGITYADNWMQGDDFDYAQKVAATAGFDHRIVQGDETTLHYGGLDGLPLTDLPSDDAILLGYNLAKQRVVKAVNATTHVTGTGGDTVLHARNVWMADLYRSGQRVAAMRRAYLEARRLTIPSSKLMAAVRKLAKVSYAEAVTVLARDVLAPPNHKKYAWDAIAWCRLVEAAGWLNPSARSSVSGRLKEVASDARAFVYTSDLHDWYDLDSVAQSRAVTAAVASANGVTLYNPFLDTRVVDACLGVPAFVRVSGPRFKPLLRAAFGKELPAFLLDRTTKGDFAGTMYAGLYHNRAWLRMLLRESRLVREGVVEEMPISEALERAINGLPAPLGSLHRFVVLELWLRALRLNRTDWWEANG